MFGDQTGLSFDHLVGGGRRRRRKEGCVTFGWLLLLLFLF